MARPFEAYRGRKLGQVNDTYAAYLTTGFATADFDDQPQAETLQCRNELDRTNWLGLLLKAQAMIAADQGDTLCDPPIRCTSNQMYRIPYTEVEARMFDLLDKVGAAQANWWRLKDAVQACPMRDDLNLIDLSEGWP